jgi:hypothetical protein
MNMEFQKPASLADIEEQKEVYKESYRNFLTSTREPLDNKEMRSKELIGSALLGMTKAMEFLKENGVNLEELNAEVKEGKTS